MQKKGGENLRTNLRNLWVRWSNGVLRYHSYVSQNNTKFIYPLKDFWDCLGPPKMVDGQIMGTMDNRRDFFSPSK